MKFSVQNKLLAGFLSIVILLAGVTAAGFVGLNEVVAQYEDLSGRIQQMQLQGRMVQLLMTDQARAFLNGYLLTSDRAYEAQYEEAAAELEAVLADMAEMLQTAESEEILQRVRESKDAYQATAVLLFGQQTLSPGVMESMVSSTLPQLRSRFLTAVEDLIASGRQVRPRDPAASPAGRPPGPDDYGCGGCGRGGGRCGHRAHDGQASGHPGPGDRQPCRAHGRGRPHG